MRLDHLLSMEKVARDQGSEPYIEVVRPRRANEMRGNEFAVQFSVTGEGERKERRKNPRGCSSDGRAPALQAGGQGFDSPHLHRRSAERGKEALEPHLHYGL